MAIAIPFPLPSKGFALNSKVRVNFDFVVAKFNEFNTGAATWDTVAVGTGGSITGAVTLYNSSNGFYTTIQSGVATANQTYTWPTAVPASVTSVLQSTTSGVLSWTASPTFTSVESTSLVLPNVAGFDTVLKCHPSTATDFNFFFPQTAGSAGQFLTSDGTYSVWADTPVRAGAQNRLAVYADAGSAAFVSDYLSNNGFGIYFNVANHAALSANRNYTIPDAGTSASFVMSGTAPSFSGLSVLAPGAIDVTSFFVRGISGNNRTTFYRTDGGSNIDWYFPNAQGAANSFLKNDGAGALTWETLPAVGANTALSNLASVAINTSLVSDADVTDDLGSSSVLWRKAYTQDLDLGKSGTAGSVTIYPAVASKGWILINAAPNTNNDGLIIENAPQAGSRTYTIPDAGASASFVMTKGAQQIDGAKTFGESITSDTDNTDDLGSSSIGWKDAYVKGSLDLSNGFIAIKGGADGDASTRTDNTIKNFRCGVAHYDNEDDPATVFFAQSGTTNVLNIGGGTSSMNAMTTVNIRTGSGNSTATGTTCWSASAEGSVTQPLQPSFLATKSADTNDQTGDGTTYTVICDTEIFDQGSDYDHTTGVFTAPVTGKYAFSASIRIENSAAGHDRMITSVVTSNRNYTVEVSGLGAKTFYSIPISVICEMEANDTASITIWVNSSTKTVDISGAGTDRVTFFSGSLIN